MSRQPWFERRFQFDLPPQNHRDVLARLMSAPLLVHALGHSLDPTTATTRDGSRWSIQENIGHLLDLEPLWATRTDELLAGAAVLSAADLDNQKTHDADHNTADLTALVRSFARTRSAWVDRLQALDAADFARSSRHPRLEQPMRLVDHCVFVAEHDAHHLGRILERLEN